LLENVLINIPSGELDFWIDRDLKWAIELLRLGAGKGEHLSRFGVGGKYAALQPNAARVVDIRPASSKPSTFPDNYVAVLVAEDCKSAEVCTKMKTTTIKLTGNPPDSNCSIPEWQERVKSL
jgi:hypothetical protein